ncbi:Por secretion system C-terminal sorting domain-containing protein [Cnuella takakiae]|uniref:Por secretion system C-terminal sorting domain-containing protein n=1 Tax=Cnuella takakiae TaxID=1302690 RepID=A0A1M5GHH9_9BACT|nr:M4 family metallopeptidase [Cnuella takakiae]SHG03195.1 Por secretion system C-terminal sorting domain-containing protein [Cnuella takakiae]
MKKIYFQKKQLHPWARLMLLLALLPLSVVAQGPPSLSPKMEVLAKPNSNPNWIEFREDTRINPSTIFREYKDAFGLKAGDSMLLQKKSVDELKFNHFRYQQLYKNRRVVYGEYIVHQQPDGFVKSANGKLITGINQPEQASVTEKQALASALQFMNASKYLWQNANLEKELKAQMKNDQATYFPKGELVYAPNNNENLAGANYRLAWHFKVYTDDPKVVAKSVYVDAITGKVINSADIAMNCSGGSGTSAFNGTVAFNTTNFFGVYLSQNNCQSTSLIVYNCNGAGPANDLYADADNNWNLASQQSAVQAQWGTKMTYDYFFGQHNRAGWNGASASMITYNNAYLGSNNACWGCTGNSAIFYAGNTSGATDDWNTNDIVGHEFAHGVTQSEANLVYSGESGALNESFSDIFGEMVESWSEGINDYLIGGDRGAIRSMRNPNLYGDPDTYRGTNWYTGSLDNGGVHTNSGVQNHWFYLVSEGGSGTDDFGRAYSVTGITRFKARLIAYRALTQYLTSSSGYIDARRATLQAAWDIYGQCSQEIIAVGNAWHAVGVEAQSPAFAFNVCGTYPTAGTFIQAISQLTASAGGCATNITPSATTVYFTARDRVILNPGFRAAEGSKFIAYLEPCSSTRWADEGPATTRDDLIVMSDPEKGIKPQVEATTSIAKADRAPMEDLKQPVVILPNPFQSTFEVIIQSDREVRGRVTLYNAMGEKLQEKQGIGFTKGQNKASFNGSSLPAGVYLVEIIKGNERTVKKITKL